MVSTVQVYGTSRGAYSFACFLTRYMYIFGLSAESKSPRLASPHH